MVGTGNAHICMFTRIGSPSKLNRISRGRVLHEMGVTCSINGVKFDALFDTGSEHVQLKPAIMDKIRDRYATA
jgi:hypothetical protein